MNKLIKERLNDPSEDAKAELELLLKRLKQINGEDNHRVFCKKMNCYVDAATCLKRAEKNAECQNCEVYLNFTNKLPMELVEVDPRTLEDSGYDEGLFPQMSPEEHSLLVEAVKTVGFFIPVVIFDNKIVCGRERVRAAIAAGQKTIPALQVNTTERKLKLMAIVENICRKVPRSVDYKRAMDRYQELRANPEEKIVPLNPEQAVDHIEHLPDQYKEEISKFYGEEAQEIYINMKSQLRHLASLVKNKINELTETIRNQKTELQALKLEYEEEKQRLTSQNTDKLFEYRRRITDLESQLKQKESTLKAEIEILRSELEDTASREKEVERLYNEAEKRLKTRPVVEKYPEDYKKLKEETARLKKRIKEFEDSTDIAHRYDRHRDAIYAAFSFLKMHIPSLKKTIPQVEIKTLINHLKTLTKILEKEIEHEKT